MPTAEYVTTDFYLSAFLVHKGATLLGLRRLGPKKVEFRFAAGASLHEHLRLYWSGAVAPVIPWEMFLCYRRLKCLSIDRYDPSPVDGSGSPPAPAAPPSADADR